MRKLGPPVVLIVTLWLAALRMSGADKPHTVLVIYSNERSLPANIQVNEKLRETLGVSTNLDLQYQTEYLDYPRYADESDGKYDKLISTFLRSKYENEHVDVVIAGGPQAFHFLLRHQDDLFVNAPVIAIVTNPPSLDDGPVPARFIRMASDPELRPTFELAMKLQPKASDIVVVTGASKYDRDWEAKVKKTLTEWTAHPPVRYLSGLSLEDVASQLSRLPRNTIVYSPGMQLDGAGKANAARDVVKRMSERSSAPIYSSYSTILGYGMVGGYIFEMGDAGRQAGEVTKRILKGEKLSQKDMPASSPASYVVDWKELRRWNLSEALLPEGTITLNRDPTPWEKYRVYILGTVLLLILEALLILYLLAEQRRRRVAQEQLAERLKIEVLVAFVSSKFANLEEAEIDQAILYSLQRLREVSRSSMVCIWQLANAQWHFYCTHQWPEKTSGIVCAYPSVLPNTQARLLGGETVIFCRGSDTDNFGDSESFRQARIRSFLGIPIRSENQILGAFTLVNVAEGLSWPQDIIPQLSTIADILGGALVRQRNAEALSKSEGLKGAILDYLQSSLVVIDRTGLIVEVNQHWVDTAMRDGASSRYVAAVGENYLHVCQEDIGSEEAIAALAGIKSVLAGAQQTFETEYACPSPRERRWFRMTVIHLPRSTGGALIIHFDITSQKIAELNRERMQEEMAQLHRATEMGQLVASLAHELAQPLSAVLTNAQAAAYLAEKSEPDLPEIRAALSDIIEDDQRARSVLNNVRALLKKHAITPHRVNLNKVVDDVVLMVRSSAQARGMQLKTLLSQEPVFVQGDEIPLQQVLLNLVNNAMDAMSQIPMNQRVLTLKTAIDSLNERGVLVVEDQGPGVPEAMQTELFQPFFTTKGDGLGMGLAICQTILLTLGGSIELRDSPGTGATFKVCLPTAL